MSESDVSLGLFLGWLNSTHDRHFHLDSRGDGDAVARDGDVRLKVSFRSLLDGAADAAWTSNHNVLQDRLSEGAPGAVALWVPAGADLPRGEPAASVFVEEVRQAAVRLGPNERSYIPFPIRLLLRKTAESGGVVSVTGGLNPHWARFTERVSGTYDLDSTQLHRLPESDAHLECLLDTIVEEAASLEVGRVAEIETIDSWTIQRVAGDDGLTILGVPPSATADLGLAVRRNLRRILVETAPMLRQADETLKAIILGAPYARLEQEGVTTAIRGCDPALYAGVDFICLACDGRVKPLVQSPTAVVR